MARYDDELRTYVYTDEVTTNIKFPSDHAFAAYRDAVRERYSAAMVQVERYSVQIRDGSTVASVHHSRGLGAELRGLAYGEFGGNTLASVEH